MGPWFPNVVGSMICLGGHPHLPIPALPVMPLYTELHEFHIYLDLAIALKHFVVLNLLCSVLLKNRSHNLPRQRLSLGAV